MILCLLLYIIYNRISHFTPKYRSSSSVSYEHVWIRLEGEVCCHVYVSCPMNFNWLFCLRIVFIILLLLLLLLLFTLLHIAVRNCDNLWSGFGCSDLPKTASAWWSVQNGGNQWISSHQVE